MRFPARLTCLPILCLIVGGAGTAAAEEVRLAPHRAVYELTLDKSAGSRSVEGARGRIAFDFTGNACEGYNLSYRQVTVLDSGETGAKTSDLRTATFESGDGKSLRFRNESFGDNTQKMIDGTAENRPDGSMAVKLREGPKPTTVSLQEALFPNAHMKHLIAAAREGQTTLAVKVFDGSDDGRKVYDTLAVIGKRLEPGTSDALEASAKQDGLSKLPRWPVVLSYFAPGEGERTPVYTLTFELYDNGVSRALKLDYGEFALKGEMQTLQLLPDTACRR